LNDIEKLNLGAFIPLFKEIIKITKDKAHQEGPSRRKRDPTHCA